MRTVPSAQARSWTVSAACSLMLFVALGCGSASAPPAQPDAKSNPVPEAKKQDAPTEVPTLTLLTYNIDAHGPKLKERNAAILVLLREVKADVMAFQEADAAFVSALSEEDWIKGVYRLTKLKGEGTAVRGVILCSRLHVEKWEYRVLPGNQARAAVLIHTTLHGQKFFFATTHLESPLEDETVRVAQLDLLFGRLNEADGAVLMGDLNFGDGAKPESDRIPAAYADPWLALNMGKPGYTWDLAKNAQAKSGSFAGETSRRLDRILVRSSHLKPKSVRFIGEQPLGNDDPTLLPSDHFGVVATFSWE